MLRSPLVFSDFHFMHYWGQGTRGAPFSQVITPTPRPGRRLICMFYSTADWLRFWIGQSQQRTHPSRFQTKEICCALRPKVSLYQYRIVSEKNQISNRMKKMNVSLRGGRNTEQGGLFWCNDMWRQATFCFPL